MENTIILDERELQIVREKCEELNQFFDPKKNEYTLEELGAIGIVRESYSVKEMRSMGFDNSGVVTSFDQVASLAQEKLKIGAPFAKGVTKWQLPIDVEGIRIMTTVFPPNTTVLSHVHSVLDENVKSGGLRIVVTGSIIYEGKKYSPGDWFFVPNGTAYSFTTDPKKETKENYFYSHNHHGGFSRVSSPKKH